MARKRSRKKSRPAGALGSGARFRALTGKLRKRGARTPRALAAWIGRKKYGKSKFQSLSKRGRSKRRKKK